MSGCGAADIAAAESLCRPLQTGAGKLTLLPEPLSRTRQYHRYRPVDGGRQRHTRLSHALVRSLPRGPLAAGPATATDLRYHSSQRQLCGGTVTRTYLDYRILWARRVKRRPLEFNTRHVRAPVFSIARKRRKKVFISSRNVSQYALPTWSPLDLDLRSSYQVDLTKSTTISFDTS